MTQHASAQRACDTFRDFVLDREDIIERTVETLRPTVITSGDFDELDRYAQAITCFTNTAFEQCPDAELLPYCANVGACIAKLILPKPGESTP